MKEFILLLSLALVAGCGSQHRQPEEIIRKVKIEPVQYADSLLERSFPGMIREAGEVNLAFRVAGLISTINVKEGDYIRAGQPVALIDPRDYEVQLEAARAQYEQVKAEAGRVTELHNRRSVAVNDYDKAVSGLKLATAQLKHATDQLSDTRLTAPFSGYIHKVSFREKELVDAGMPVATMIDVGQYLVEVDIPVAVYASRDLIISFTGVQPALSTESFPLQLVSFSRKAGNNQLYRLQLSLTPAASPQLAPGMDVEVTILTKNNLRPQVCVPLTALFSESGKSFVWVYQPGGTVTKRQVETGKLTGDGRIRINGGVQAGDQVVVAGVSLLQNNQRVEPVKPVSGTNVGGLL